MHLKKYQWFLLPACLVLGIGLLFAFVSLSQDYLSEYLVENSKPLLGQKLDLANLASHLKDSRLAEFAKNPPKSDVILIFWSSTCAPCLTELPRLSADNPGVLLVPINTDPEGGEAAAAKTLSDLAPEFPFLHDSKRFLEESLKITYLPTHVTIDRDGFIKKFHVGKN